MTTIIYPKDIIGTCFQVCFLLSPFAHFLFFFKKINMSQGYRGPLSQGSSQQAETNKTQGSKVTLGPTGPWGVDRPRPSLGNRILGPFHSAQSSDLLCTVVLSTRATENKRAVHSPLSLRGLLRMPHGTPKFWCEPLPAPGSTCRPSCRDTSARGPGTCSELNHHSSWRSP